jgi:hypothetical protein
MNEDFKAFLFGRGLSEGDIGGLTVEQKMKFGEQFQTATGMFQRHIG